MSSTTTTTNETRNLIPAVATIQDPAKLRDIYEFTAYVYGSETPTLSYNPCPLPISLSRNQLTYVKGNCNDYVVSEKMDGVRYQLILCEYSDGRQCSVMMDRNLNCYEVPVTAKRSFFRNGTILDGELVWEYHSPSGSFFQTFIIFDVYICAGDNTLHYNFIERMSIIQDLVDMDENLRDKKKTWESCAEIYASEGKIVSLGNLHSLIFIKKPCFNLSNFAVMLRNKSKFQSDGILFTPISDAVRFGRHPKMFKWKPHQTVDVLVSMQYHDEDDEKGKEEENGQWILKSFLWDTNQIVQVDTLQISDMECITLQISKNTFVDSLLHHLLYVKNTKSYKVLLEMDVELDIDSGACKLFAVKRRVDKSHPNSVDTVTRTVNNIREDISLTYIQEYLMDGDPIIT